MSKEINNSQIEDFVWVQLSEVPQEASATSEENSRDCHTNFGDVTNVVQWIHSKTTSDESLSFGAFGNVTNVVIRKDDTDENDLWSHNESEFEIEINVIRKCFNSQDNPSIPTKKKYTKPFYRKAREHGTYKDKKEDKHNSEEQKNKLPKMKFDSSTTAVLEMLVNNGYLEQYNELVGMGKNSVVFHAFRNGTPILYVNMQYENAVKIYRTYKDEMRNEAIFKKVQREFEHLSILGQSTVLYGYVPWAIRAWKNVILMSYIGVKKHPYLHASIEDIPYEKDKKIYHDIIDFIEKCYNIAHLVHGKLSARNIIVGFDTPHFLGWSHSVKRSHPLAMTKLINDCHFVTEFYKRRGLKVKSARDLFQQITKRNKISESLLKMTEVKDLYDKYDTNPNRKSTNLKKSTHRRFK